MMQYAHFPEGASAPSFFQTNCQSKVIFDTIFKKNNPVMYCDPSGHSFSSALLMFAGVSLLTWAAGELFGQQLVGGIGSVTNGICFPGMR